MIVKNVVSARIRNERMEMVMMIWSICNAIAKALLNTAVFALVFTMAVPPSNGHDPEGLLFMGVLALLLLSISKFSLRFLDFVFFLITLLLMLTFSCWSSLLLEWLFVKRGLL